MQVTKDAVSNFQVGRRIPHCAFELQLLGGKTRRLLHRVNLTGVAYPEFFHIRYPQPERELILQNKVFALSMVHIMPLAHDHCKHCKHCRKILLFPVKCCS